MTVPTPKPEKAAFWSKHIADWQVSGLRQKEYCTLHGLHVKNFGRWKGVLKQRSSPPPTTPLAATAVKPTPLIPLSIIPEIDAVAVQAQEQPGSGIRLHVQSKYVIDIDAGFHAPTLQQLLTVLG